MRKLFKMLLVSAAAGSSFGLAADTDPKVALFETNLGNFVVETYSSKAPETAANFVDLVESGFYDGLIFHRVIPNFVVQAGGMDTNMQSKEPPRTIKNESDNGLQNLGRTLSMARTSDPDSASSQFFVNLQHNPHLDYKPGAWGYAVFGKVVGGWEVIEKIAALETGPGDVPTSQAIIQKAGMVERADVQELLD